MAGSSPGLWKMEQYQWTIHYRLFAATYKTTCKPNKNKKAIQRKNAERLDCIGADERSRTAGLLITNQLLYQLSYVGFHI